ncbi:hypothetical protein C6T68_29985 [Burkholderia multivorans]|nr:hypothetical protein C6T68_29985 [Burkholderia multivorans]
MADEGFGGGRRRISETTPAGVVLPSEVCRPEPLSICLPTCSAGLTKRQEKCRESLTTGVSPARSAREVATR